MTLLTNKQEPPDQLASLDLPALGPVPLTWLETEPRLADQMQADGRLSARIGGRTLTYVVEYKSSWNERSFQAAIEQARRYASASPPDLPLVVLPYLNDAHLNQLTAAGVSGLDLCGNAYLTDGQNWLLFITGRPNRFKTAQPLKSPYWGQAGLVARTLLVQPTFPDAQALRAGLLARGGTASQPVVSRALTVLRNDLIVSNARKSEVRLLDPKRLLGRLADEWGRKGQAKVLWRGRMVGSPQEFMPELFAEARHLGVRLGVTGLGSATRYASLATENVAYLYADRPGELLPSLAKLGGEETRRFPNLEIRTAPDEGVFFNLRPDAQGVGWAPPVQTYLELQSGDARLQQGADGVEQQVILELQNSDARLQESADGVAELILDHLAAQEPT